MQYDLDFKRYLTKLHLRLEERMKRETVRKKAKWASEWAHGHAERRIIRRQIYIQPNFPLYAPGSTKSGNMLSGSEPSLFTVTVEEEHLSLLCGWWQKVQNNLISKLLHGMYEFKFETMSIFFVH